MPDVKHMIKKAIQRAFVDLGGTPSHHHAVGTELAACWSRISPLLACT
jgi:hypothetical protein